MKNDIYPIVDDAYMIKIFGEILKIKKGQEFNLIFTDRKMKFKRLE